MTPTGDSVIRIANDLNLQGMYNGWENVDYSVDPIWTTVEPSCQDSAAFLDFLGIDALGTQDIFIRLLGR